MSDSEHLDYDTTWEEDRIGDSGDSENDAGEGDELYICNTHLRRLALMPD